MNLKEQFWNRRDVFGTSNSRDGYRKVIFLFIAFLFVILFRTFLLERIIIEGSSMYPTLKNEDVCFVWKVNKKPIRYEIVTANVSGKTVVKRVVGVPGDELSVREGTVYINGCPVSQEYDFITEEPGVLSGGYVVRKDEYFLLGDNRAESNDSRVYGAVSLKQIKGVVVVRIYPLTQIAMYSLRRSYAEGSK
jgi:hypothetical protein